MIVVADAGPLNYLLLIEAANMLEPLYTRVLMPHAVAAELQEPGAPPMVRTWIAEPPEWCEIRLDPPPDPALQYLGPGERAAITLALSLNVARLLIDERAGRVEAERRSLTVTGTLGVLAEAHARRMLDFDAALARLHQTNFYLSPALIDRIHRQLLTGRR
jgi:predicted nucleic acid-binding protein